MRKSMLRVSRNGIAFQLLVLSVLFISSHAVGDSGKMRIIANSKPTVEIVCAAEKSKTGELVYAGDKAKSFAVLGDTIAEYFFKSSGERPVVSKGKLTDNSKIAIHLGNTDYVKSLKLNTSDFDEDEFLIMFPDKKNIVIIGEYQHGIEWGVCEFLERMLGVRWLFAGELGEHVPKHTNLSIPMVEVKDKPQFLSRAISFNNKRRDLTKWVRLSRLRRRIKKGHYLGILISPRKYFKDHPEFFPTLKGKRVKPNSLIAWQPCFTAPGIAECAASTVIRYFKSNPTQSTFSFGANDNGGYCECERCLKMDGGKVNLLGMADRSRSYYKFCSKVAELARKGLPGRKLKFGLLAYTNVIEVPVGEKVDPGLVPFLTTDDYKWADAGVAAREREWIKRWGQAVPEFGMYDYIYGGFYSIPRIYLHHMADYLREINKLGAKHYYGEAYIPVNYKEGPKFYLLMKLLWNPNLSVDAVLQEWYECAVGKKAAPSLAAYFKLLEDFWMERVPKGTWFNDSKNKTYLAYNKNGYFDEIKGSDFERMESLLRETLAKADGEKAKKRARLWLDGFLETKLLVMTRKKFKEMNSPNFKTVDDRIVFLDAFDAKSSWNTWKNRASFTKFEPNAKGGRNGSGCLLIDKNADKAQPTPPDACFITNQMVAPGALYRVSVWVKMVDCAIPLPKAKDSVSMTVRWREKDGKTWVHFVGLQFKKNIPITIDGKWRKVEMIVPAPNLRQIRYATILLGSSLRGGVIMFDDFKMTKVVNQKEADKNNAEIQKCEKGLLDGTLANIAPNHSFENIATLQKSGYSIWPPKIQPSASISTDDASDGKQSVKFNNIPAKGSINRFFRGVKPGERYFVAFDCKRKNGSACHLSVGWRTAKVFFPPDSPFRVEVFNSTPSKKEGWDTFKAIVTVPPKAVVLVLIASLAPVVNGGDDECLIDNIKVARLD